MGQQAVDAKQTANIQKKRRDEKPKRGFLSKLFSGESKHNLKKRRTVTTKQEPSLLDDILRKCNDIQSRLKTLEEICARVDARSAVFASYDEHSASGDIGVSVASPSYTMNMTQSRSRQSCDVKHEVRELIELIRSRIDLFQNFDDNSREHINPSPNQRNKFARNQRVDEDPDLFTDEYRAQGKGLGGEYQCDDGWSDEVSRHIRGGVYMRRNSSDTATPMGSSIPSAISEVACSRVSSSFSSPISSLLKGGKVANIDMCSVNTSDMTVFQKFRRIRRVCSTCSRSISCEDVSRFQPQ